MITKLRLWLLWLIAICALLPPTTVSQATYAYDCQDQGGDVYHHRSEPVSAYDTATMLTVNESGSLAANLCAPLAVCATFLAAEGTATQLEFNFAKDFGQNSGLVIGRGADLSAPGALGAGEYKLGWFSVQETSGMDAEWAVN